MPNYARRLLANSEPPSARHYHHLRLGTTSHPRYSGKRLGWPIAWYKLRCRRSASDIVLLSGIWICGLSSSYPLINLGKQHPFLTLFPRVWRTTQRQQNHLGFLSTDI